MSEKNQDEVMESVVCALFLIALNVLILFFPFCSQSYKKVIKCDKYSYTWNDNAEPEVSLKG